MSNIGEIVLDYNFLECPVCLELFDDTCKMLPCQHTFHKRCLQKILSVEERLECPQCRQLVSEDIELLPRNYFLISVLDKAKPKPSESDQESMQLQFVIEKSKSEAEVKAREEYLLSQKEKLEYELMLLKSEKKGCAADDDGKSKNSSTSLVCGYTFEGVATENDSSTTIQPFPNGEEAASLLVEEFGSISVFDSSLESPKKNESPLHDSCYAMLLEPQVTDGFKTLNMFETQSELVEKLLVIVRAVDAGKNFEGIDLMHLIDYDDLIETYLKILTDQLKENTSAASSYPTAAPRLADIPNPNPAPASGSSTFCQNFVVRVPAEDEDEDVPLDVNRNDDLSYCGDNTGAMSSAVTLPEFNPCQSTDYQTYTFDDDDRNLNYALELSRQLVAGIEPDDQMEEVLIKSKITCTVDQQKQIFLGIREKVELQIALLMSKI